MTKTVFQFLPRTWKLVTIGELGQIVTGCTPSTSHPEYYEGDIPFVSPSDIGASRFISGAQSSLSATGASKARMIPTNSVMVTCIGLLGKVGQADISLATNQQINSIVPFANVEPAYIFWVSHLLKPQMEVVAGLQVVPIVNKTTFSGLLLPFPPLSGQRTIAAILDTIHAAIQQTDSLIAKLRQMKAGLLHDLLTRGLDENGELRDPVAHPEQFKASALGLIPREWEITPLEAKKRIDRPYIKTGPFGSSLKGEHWVEEGVPVITIGSLGEGKFIESELLYITESKADSLAAYAVEPGDLVFSRVADVGRSVVVRESEEGWIMSSNLMRIALDPVQVIPQFAYLNLVFNDVTRQQIRRFVNAGGREIANTPILNSMRFTWPSYEEQCLISEIVVSYDSRIRAEETARDKLALLKRGLMNDLLTGRVRVTGLDLPIEGVTDES